MYCQIMFHYFFKRKLFQLVFLKYKIFFQKTLILLFLFPIAISGCSTSSKIKKSKPVVVYLEQSNFSSLPDWHSDSHYSALLTFQRSCQTISKQDGSAKTFPAGNIHSWQKVCKASANISNNKEAKIFFEKWFKPYRVFDENKSNLGKFTGYYEIELEGSHTQTKKYSYPIYHPPLNLHKIKGSKHISHSAINKGSLSNQGLEIAWVKDPIELYFLHIQGSGVIKLDNGNEIKVGYAECNGFSYKGLDKCIKECDLPINYAVNMKQLMQKDKQTALKIMERNHSYVFFHKKNDGPIGAQGVLLEPVRSIAIDSRLFSYGTPFWLDTNGPVTGGKIRRLMIAQDRGGAIKGAIRSDIFCGRGKKAEKLATMLNHKGQYYALFPKDIKIPSKFVSH